MKQQTIRALDRWELPQRRLDPRVGFTGGSLRIQNDGSLACRRLAALLPARLRRADPSSYLGARQDGHTSSSPVNFAGSTRSRSGTPMARARASALSIDMLIVPLSTRLK